ncbi:hypothetical protein [Hyphomicrobium sp.]|uniref:hypothetical protein n=1 Tax=Hyphomicrobium sp. TaxID=82 RepID=UPI002E2F8288|nr:hypothetical protein [Hyphomicrobium sp.]HEX2839918.1 hypothetical protein [Hyphomicrobium sp.]
MRGIDVLVGARERRLIAALMAILTGATTPALAENPQAIIEATAAREDFYFEAVMETLSLLFTGAGEEKKGVCVTDSYFGSPLGQRVVLYSLWMHRDKLPETVAIPLFDEMCAEPDGATSKPSAAEWRAAAMSQASTPSWENADMSMVLFAGMRTMFTFAAVQLMNPALAQCVVEKYDDALEAKILGAGQTRPPLHALYDEMRSLCTLFPNGPASKNMVMTKIPDIDGAARERLLTVAELKACDRYSGSSRKECAEDAFKARMKALR